MEGGSHSQWNDVNETVYRSVEHRGTGRKILKSGRRVYLEKKAKKKSEKRDRKWCLEVTVKGGVRK